MFESFLEVNEAFPWFFAGISFVLGACMGSFFNVVIYRLPRKMSIVKPGSHCFACKTPIQWYDNIPVLGWLLLRGKARCCGAPFSPRYAVIELMTGLLFMTAWLQLSPLAAVASWSFISLLLIGAFIDFDTMELPDFTTVGGAALGLVLSIFVPQLHGFTPEADGMHPILASLLAFRESALGMLVGSGMILWIAMFAEKLLRKEAMGFGDVLLLGCVGSFCGWQGAIFSIFGGSIIGMFAIISLTIVNKLTGWQLTPGVVDAAIHSDSQADKSETQTDHDSDNTEQSPISSSDEPVSLGLGAAVPFGPWLAAGALVYLLGMQKSVDAYFAFIGQLFELSS